MKIPRLVLLLGLLVACGSRRAEPPPAPPVAAPVTPLAAPDDSERLAPGPSVYDLPLALRDADDREIGLDVGRGHPVLISMFYASCSVACPVLIDDLAKTIDQLAPEDRADVRVVLVSFDPERDRPEVLRAVAARHRLDPRWTLAVATDHDARTLAAVLGLKYRRLDNGEFAHGATIVALDRDGVPVARSERVGRRASLIAGLHDAR